VARFLPAPGPEIGIGDEFKVLVWFRHGRP
jgi:hypothetical protein